MKQLITALVAVALVMLVNACGGSSIIPPYEQPTHETVYSSFAGTDRIYGAPGLADPGAEAVVVDYDARTTVRADGSFSIDFSRTASQKKSSLSLVPPLFIVNYFKNGELVEELIFEADYDVDTVVQNQLFSTGSGPNDMLFGNDSLYIANSMDNTVTRHSLDGELLATSQFNEFASPSYLGIGNGDLLVTSNGENRFWQLDLLDLSGYLASSLPGTYEDVAFPGPGQPAYLNEFHLVPFAWIETFSPTVYGSSHVTVAHEHADFVSPDLTLGGKNSQFAAVDSENSVYYVVSTGEIQFDEFWTPYADSDSFLTAFESDNIGYEDEGSRLNLGPIGAGRIAISPDGRTAYLGNSLSGTLYRVNLGQPLPQESQAEETVLTTEYTFISDVAFTPDGKYILATSFNTDELYVVDAATGEVNPGPYPAPFNLSLDPELMAGAANVEVVPDSLRPGKYCAYVMFGVANTVAKIDLF